MKTSRSLSVLLSGLVLAGGVFAQASVGSDTEARKLSAAAAARLEKVGKDQALKEFATDKQWVVKDLTVWVMDMDGVMLFHANPKMVGKHLMEVRDQSGRAYNKEMVAIGAGAKPGTVSYEWSHPETKKLAPKVAFITPAQGTGVFAAVSVTH